MAKRVATKIRSVQNAKPATTANRSTAVTSRLNLSRLNLGGRGRNWQKMVGGVIAAPATMYIAGGLGVAFLARFAYKYYNSHPEISTFVGGKIDSVETKLKEYRSNIVGSTDLSEEASH